MKKFLLIIVLALMTTQNCFASERTDKQLPQAVLKNITTQVEVAVNEFNSFNERELSLFDEAIYKGQYVIFLTILFSLLGMNIFLFERRDRNSLICNAALSFVIAFVVVFVLTQWVAYNQYKQNYKQFEILEKQAIEQVLSNANLDENQIFFVKVKIKKELNDKIKSVYLITPN